MREYIIFSLGDLIKGGYTEKDLSPFFNDFTCEREKDLEIFLRNKAITYDNSNLGKTSLIIDKDSFDQGKLDVMAFFTIGQTSVDIGALSNNKKKKLLGSVPGRDKLLSYQAYLIGQLGRSDMYTTDEFLNRVIDDNFPFFTEAIIHMGAISATTEKNMEKLLKYNYLYTKELAKYCLPKNARFIYASSAATYGNGDLGYDDDHSKLEAYALLMHTVIQNIFLMFGQKKKKLLIKLLD